MSGSSLYFVLIRYVERWLPFIRDDGEQAITADIDIAHRYLSEAKQHVAYHSKPGRMAAVSVRLAFSHFEELEGP